MGPVLPKLLSCACTYLIPFIGSQRLHQQPTKKGEARWPSTRTCGYRVSSDAHVTTAPGQSASHPRSRSQPRPRMDQIPSPSSHVLRICAPNAQGLWDASMKMRSPKSSKTNLLKSCQPFLLHWVSGANGQFAALATKSIRSMDDREPKIVPFAPSVLDIALVNVHFSSFHLYAFFGCIVFSHSEFPVILYSCLTPNRPGRCRCLDQVYHIQSIAVLKLDTLIRRLLWSYLGGKSFKAPKSQGAATASSTTEFFLVFAHLGILVGLPPKRGWTRLFLPDLKQL